MRNNCWSVLVWHLIWKVLNIELLLCFNWWCVRLPAVPAVGRGGAVGELYTSSAVFPCRPAVCLDQHHHHLPAVHNTVCHTSRSYLDQYILQYVMCLCLIEVCSRTPFSVLILNFAYIITAGVCLCRSLVCLDYHDKPAVHTTVWYLCPSSLVSQCDIVSFS